MLESSLSVCLSPRLPRSHCSTLQAQPMVGAEGMLLECHISRIFQYMVVLGFEFKIFSC
jgi:hypothetical protein